MIGAVVVLYNPWDSVLELINTLVTNNLTIVLVRNEEGACLPLHDVLSCHVIYNHNQNGISGALNIGLNYLFNIGCEWAFTFDQDSMPEDNMISNLIQYLELYRTENIASIAPRFVCNSTKISSKLGFVYKDSVITSGNLINLGVYKKIGGFKDELFIDSVDFEFCLNLRKNGYKIIQVNDAVLFHNLGESKILSIFGKTFNLSIHSPLRRYYMFRNNVYVQKKYFSRFPQYCIKRNIFLLIEIFQIILFERDKRKNIKMVVKGLLDGMLSKYGKYNGRD